VINQSVDLRGDKAYNLSEVIQVGRERNDSWEYLRCELKSTKHILRLESWSTRKKTFFKI